MFQYNRKLEILENLPDFYIEKVQFAIGTSNSDRPFLNQTKFK